MAFHEVLGHGSGKLYMELAPGEFNFDMDNLPFNPMTGNRFETWYKAGQTSRSEFGTSYEECRAELIALHYLSVPESLSNLGFDVDIHNDASSSSTTAEDGESYPTLLRLATFSIVKTCIFSDIYQLAGDDQEWSAGLVIVGSQNQGTPEEMFPELGHSSSSTTQPRLFFSFFFF